MLHKGRMIENEQETIPVSTSFSLDDSLSPLEVEAASKILLMNGVRY